MSSRRPLVVLSIVIAGTLPASHPAAAQSVAAARLRMASLAESLAAVRRQQGLRDARERPHADTVAMGPMRIEIAGQVPSGFHEAVPIAWQLLRRRYGTLADSVTGLISVSPGANQEVGFEQLYLTVRPMAERWDENPVVSSARAPVDTLAATLADVAARSLWPRAGSQMREWVQGIPPASEIPAGDLQQLYIELVTSAWHSGRRCFEGDLTACRRALGVAATTRPAMDWYDAEDRRALVKRFRQGPTMGARPGQVQACVERGELGTCDFLLSQLPAEWISPSLSATARRSLLVVALRNQGAEAFRRLVARPSEPVGDRLALAAGIPLDSLIAEWRTEILQARPPVVAVSSRSGWLAFGWALLLALLALGSTRWR